MMPEIDGAKAIAIPWIFSENRQAKNAGNQQFLLFLPCFQRVSFMTLFKLGIVPETIDYLAEEAFWKNYLTYYQTTNFRLFQTERNCRRQFQI